MRRFNVGLALCAMLFALVAAPLFHIHDRDHDGEGILHAHFLEHESSSPISSHVETEHATGHVRWINVFTINTPIAAVFYATAEFVDLLPVPSPVINRLTSLLETSRAHSPPAAPDRSLRSPPTL